MMAETITLKKTIKPTEITEKLRSQMKTLQKYFKERNEIIEAMFASVLSGHHLVMVGPPGTGKSLLITSFCKGFGYNVFNYQLSKFTTPEEILGPYSLPALKQGRYERVTKGKLQECDIAYLDEVFNGNSSILNKLNEVMNERICEGKKIPIKSVFSGTNFIPDNNVLVAFWDRFLFRFIVDRISSVSSFKKMLTQSKYKLNSKYFVSTNEINILKKLIEKVKIKNIILPLAKIRSELAREKVYPSDRRFVWALDVLKAQAVLNDRNEVIEEDLFLLKGLLWNNKKHIPLVEQIIAKSIEPLLAKVKLLLTEANEVYQNTKTLDSKKPSELSKIMESIEKLKRIKDEVTEIISDSHLSLSTRTAATNIITQINSKAKLIKQDQLKIYF